MNIEGRNKLIGAVRLIPKVIKPKQVVKCAVKECDEEFIPFGTRKYCLTHR